MAEIRNLAEDEAAAHVGEVVVTWQAQTASPYAVSLVSLSYNLSTTHTCMSLCLGG
jgi:hypothetical protein